MTEATIYNPTTGAIFRAVIVADDEIENQAREGEAILVGVRGNWETQKVDIAADPPVLIAK